MTQAGAVILLDKAGWLHSQFHSSCGCLHKTAQNQTHQHSSIEWEGAQEPSVLSEALWTLNGFWEEGELVFIKSIKKKLTLGLHNPQQAVICMYM